MRRYTFLIGWLAHSEGADGKDTGINAPKDLVDLYLNNSEHVSFHSFEAADIEAAWDQGFAWAFHQNFTARDTVTDILDE